MSKYFKSFNSIYKEKYGNIYKIGNLKIGDNTIIFNICSAKKCPNRLNGNCQLPNTNKCYAYRDEIRYKNIKAYRDRQLAYWDEPNMIHAFIGDMIKLKTKYPNIHYLRFNEAGDIRNREDILKMCFIAKWLKQYGIKVYTYTSSRHILSQYPKIDHPSILCLWDIDKASRNNLVVNGSGYMLHNSFNVVDSVPVNNTGYICPGDCSRCNACKTVAHAPINVLKH